MYQEGAVCILLRMPEAIQASGWMLIALTKAQSGWSNKVRWAEDIWSAKEYIHTSQADVAHV